MGEVVIAGASGVVGSRVLRHLLERPDVDRVVAVGRRPLPVEHPKLVSEVADLRGEIALGGVVPQGVAVALCCLGTTLRQAGSQEAFRAVDYDAVVTFARVALARGARRFVLVSSIGADPRARTFYLRTKGEADDAVACLGYEQVTILRPSALDDEGTRPEHRTGERLMLPVARLLFSVVGRTHRYAPIRAETVARAMVRFAFDATAERVRIVDSDALHAAGA